MKLKIFTVIMLATITSWVQAEEVLTYSGICDASAAVPIDASRFVVADDEDKANSLRVYQKDKSGQAAYVSPSLSDYLQINKKKESDIEGATRIGDRIYWISSHGTNNDGEAKPFRHRFFATDIKVTKDAISLEPVGKPFVDLVKVLENSEDLKAFKLGEAAKLATKSKDGLNIESLTRTPDNQLLIGFRAPIIDEKALLVPLANPQAVLEQQAKPVLGKPILLDLGGLGIRSIEYSDAKKSYFIVAGAYGKEKKFQLYQWSGNVADAPKLINVDFQGLNPEVLIVYPEEPNRVQILSDDGTEPVNGTECKDLSKAEKKSFRGLWLTINP